MRKSIMIFIFLIIPAAAMAYSSGPPDGKTGAPGESNCTDCHSTFPVNSGNGTLTISGPAQYSPNTTYAITVQLSDQGQSRWGFEFTPLTFGTVTITDPTNTQQSSSNGKFYVKHRSAGTFAGTQDGPVSWSFNWTAPANPPDSIIFYAAGNASNNNGNNSGDYIYTASFVSFAAQTAIDDDPFALIPTHLNMNNYPNPFNAQTIISFDLPVSGNMTLSIYNLNGQLVETLVDGYQSAGTKTVNWNASDVPSGTYFYTLSVNDVITTRKMVLIK